MHSLFFIDEKTSKRERAKNWGEDETFGFIDVWAENYQELAKPGTRNTPIYKRMAEKLNQSLSPRHFTGLALPDWQWKGRSVISSVTIHAERKASWKLEQAPAFGRISTSSINSLVGRSWPEKQNGECLWTKPPPVLKGPGLSIMSRCAKFSGGPSIWGGLVLHPVHRKCLRLIRSSQVRFHQCIWWLLFIA